MFAALRTAAGDEQIELRGFKTCLERHGTENALHVRRFEIADRAALAADEMHVVAADGIVALVAVEGRYAAHLAKLLKELQVAVHRTEAQLGHLASKIGVDHLSGRMLLRCEHIFVNALSLTGITKCFHLTHLLRFVEVFFAVR